MTWGKASPALVLAAIFDALRFMFTWFVFFGPALAGIICTIQASDSIGTTAGGLLCGAGATAVGVLGSEMIAPFGIMMAMVTGFAGWLVVLIWLLVMNTRIFKENSLWFASSLLVSEVPFVNSLPAITIAVWRMYSHQINIEKAILKKYEQEQAAAQLQERRQQEIQMMQFQMNQTTQSEEQEAANDATYAETANDEEIPDEAREAAR